MDFAILAAILALFMSMGAMWLTGGVLKKLDEQNQIFLQTHISSLRKDVKGLESGLHKAEGSLADVKNIREGMQARLTEHTTQLEKLKTEMEKLNKEMFILDRSIPDRYRNRTPVAAPQPIAAKPPSNSE